MDTAIDTLVIEIETEASGSLKSIDNIIDKLNKLTESLVQNSSAIRKFKNSLSGLSNVKINNFKAPKMSRQPTDTGSTTGLGTPDKTYNKDTVNVDASGLKGIKKVLDSITKSAKKTQNALGKIGDSANNAGKKVGKSLSGMNKYFKNATKESTKLSSALKKSFSSSLTGGVRKFGLALVGVRSLFTATRSAVQEYMNYDTQLRDTLSNNWAVLGSLIAPILESVIQLFGKAVAYVRAFIQALTGIDLVAKANKKSMDGLAESSKSTLGSLAKFDDLNVVEFPSADGGGSNKLLTTPDIDTSALDLFTKKIKEGDWYGLGMEIGRLFNDGLRAIDFDWFIDKAETWATNVGDLFNGLTDGTDWNLLGSKLGQGLNTAFTFVNTFFETYNWNNLGSSLGVGMNGLVESVDWNGLGQLFINKLNALGETFSNFANTFDWDSFGNAIATSISSALSNLNLGDFFGGLSTGAQGALTSLTTMFDNIDWSSIGNNISEAFANLDLGGIGAKLGESIISIFSNLGSFLSQINWGELGTQIANFLISIDWVGVIGSVITFIGNVLLGSLDLLWGFIDGLLSPLVEKLVTWFASTDIGSAIINAFTSWFDFVKEAWSWIEPWVTLVFDNVKIALELAWDNIKNVFTLAWEAIKAVFSSVGAFFSAIWNTIAGIFKVVKAVLSGNFKDAWEAIKGIFNTWGDFFKKIWKNVKNIFAGVATFFGNIFSNAWGAVKKVFSAVGSFFSGIFDKIKGIFKNIGTTIGNAIGDSFANVVNTIIGFAENTINKFIKAINKAIGLINEIPGVDIKKLKEITIPKLATGTNRIESEGLYHLHKNEAVVPAKYNPAVNDDLYNNRGVIEALGRVYDAINALEMTNVVNVGNKTLYKETVNYAKKQNQIYGETVVTI